MAQVEFQYEGIIYTIQCQEDQKMSEIFNSFTFKANISENEISYSYNGRVLSQMIKIYLLCKQQIKWIKKEKR